MAIFRINERDYSCPVALTIDTVGGKWKAHILWHLRSAPLRYGVLKRSLGGITHKMLTQQLRELEVDGIVQRTVYNVVPPRVEYALTERGRQLLPAFEVMREWGLVFRVPEATSVIEG